MIVDDQRGPGPGDPGRWLPGSWGSGKSRGTRAGNRNARSCEGSRVETSGVYFQSVTHLMVISLVVRNCSKMRTITPPTGDPGGVISVAGKALAAMPRASKLGNRERQLLSESGY